MDIWDSLRLMIRHWKATVRVVLIGMLAVVWVYGSTATSWKIDTTQVIVGPREILTNIDEDVVTVAQNPLFATADVMTLTRTLVFAFTDPSIVNAVAEEGLSVDYTMKWDNREPLIFTDIVADSPEIAEATAERLLEMLSVELVDQQTAVGAPETEFATIQTLAVSVPVEDFRNPRLMAAIVSILTVLSAIGVAFGMERWSRRDEPALSAARRRSETMEPDHRETRRPVAVVSDDAADDHDRDDSGDRDSSDKQPAPSKRRSRDTTTTTGGTRSGARTSSSQNAKTSGAKSRSASAGRGSSSTTTKPSGAKSGPARKQASAQNKRR